MSASPSMVGGNRGLWALRVPFEHLGARVYPDMFSLAQAHNALTDDEEARRSATAGALHKHRELHQFRRGVQALPVAGRETVAGEDLGELPEPAIDRVQ